MISIFFFSFPLGAFLLFFGSVGQVKVSQAKLGTLAAHIHSDRKIWLEPH